MKTASFQPLTRASWKVAFVIWFEFLWRYCFLTLILGMFFGLITAVVAALLKQDSGVGGFIGFVATAAIVGGIVFRLIFRKGCGRYRLIVCEKKEEVDG